MNAILSDRAVHWLGVYCLVTTVKGFLSMQETFGAMAKTEKIAFILEQVRLCLDRKDYVR